MNNPYHCSSPAASISDSGSEHDRTTTESPLYYLSQLEHSIQLRDFQRALKNLMDAMRDYDEFEKIYDDLDNKQIQRWTVLADIYTKRIKVASYEAISKCSDMDILNKAPEFFDREWAIEDPTDKREQIDAFVRILRLEVEERLCDLEQNEDAGPEEKLRNREMDLITQYLEST